MFQSKEEYVVYFQIYIDMKTKTWFMVLEILQLKKSNYKNSSISPHLYISLRRIDTFTVLNLPVH